MLSPHARQSPEASVKLTTTFHALSAQNMLHSLQSCTFCKHAVRCWKILHITSHFGPLQYTIQVYNMFLGMLPNVAIHTV